ncbi:MAG: RHS repeat-associated core domain-containing protein [Spirochaetota bacterium]
MIKATDSIAGTTRTITWDDDNRMKSVTDSLNSTGVTAKTTFAYDASGTRVVKSGNLGDVVYVNANYTLRNSDLISKHVFAGNTRIVSKMSSVQTTGTATTVKDMGAFYYHGDHLGSSSVITDSTGKFYEHIEYFPYGEDWIDDKASSTSDSVAYKFTTKEYDAETGYYNFGARTYDPKLGVWTSVDKAFEKYMPSASDFDTEHDYYWYLKQDASKKLPGVGGVFNSGNLNVYSYALNNPVRYIDPDGNATALNQGEMSVLDSMRAQNKAIADPEYKAGAGGHIAKPDPSYTWCNQAAFDIIKAAGGDLSKFTKPGGRYETRANDMINVMKEGVANKNLKMATGEQAKNLANQGYTVIAAAPGHVATVASSYNKYDPEKGPTVAHVGGGNNAVMSAKSAFQTDVKNLQFFYDPKQKVK